MQLLLTIISLTQHFTCTGNWQLASQLCLLVMIYPRSWYNNATARVIFLVATDDIVWTKVSIKSCAWYQLHPSQLILLDNF